jgi:uncharacterized cupredoxin-like copper-binding protein
MRQRLVIVAAVVATAVVLAACGSGSNAGPSAAGGRTIDIDMRDNDFSSAGIQVKAGQQVQLVFHNKGAVVHDAYIGDEAAQTAHEREMSMASASGHGGHGSDGVTVEPGQTGTLTHTFDTPGTTIIGCHQQGHYALGMRIVVTVT